MSMNTETSNVTDEQEITRRSKLYVDQMININDIDPVDSRIEALAHIQAGMSVMISALCTKEAFNQFILMLATTSVVQHSKIHSNCKDYNT